MTCGHRPPDNADTDIELGWRWLEKILDHRIRTETRGLKLLAYHTGDSRKSAKGYPDWHIVGPNGSLFYENKRQCLRCAKTTPEQLQWLGALAAVPGTWATIRRPADWISGKIPAELAWLTGRVHSSFATPALFTTSGTDLVLP